MFPRGRCRPQGRQWFRNSSRLGTEESWLPRDRRGSPLAEMQGHMPSYLGSNGSIAGKFHKWLLLGLRATCTQGCEPGPCRPRFRQQTSWVKVSKKHGTGPRSAGLGGPAARWHRLLRRRAAGGGHACKFHWAALFWLGSKGARAPSSVQRLIQG